jgi:hypothetical protein
MTNKIAKPLTSTLLSSIDRAQELAADLLAHSMATFPDTLKSVIAKRVEVISIEYAVHVRRLIEQDGVKLPFIKTAVPFKTDGVAFNYELDFKKCMNAIIHSNNIEIIFLCRNDGVFINNDTVQVSSLKVNTDRFENIWVPVFGISYFFFGNVIDALRDARGNLQ